MSRATWKRARRSRISARSASRRAAICCAFSGPADPRQVLDEVAHAAVVETQRLIESPAGSAKWAAASGSAANPASVRDPILLSGRNATSRRPS